MGAPWINYKKMLELSLHYEEKIFKVEQKEEKKDKLVDEETGNKEMHQSSKKTWLLNEKSSIK